MNLKTEILNYVAGESSLSFDDLAFEIYNLQAQRNIVYKRFLEIIGKQSESPSSLEDIPLLPISVFKHQKVITGNFNEEALFQSSGTSDNSSRSHHYVKDLQYYNEVTYHIFRQFYYHSDCEIYALLPSYLENGNSSLVAMVKGLMEKYNEKGDHFYLYNFEELYHDLCKETDKKKVLFGVTFALIDFAREYDLSDCQLSIIFTGGMKNRKLEMSFEEVYTALKKSFPQSAIDAEYGMTEMFSQSYALDNKAGLYRAGSSIKILAKEINDPFKNVKINKTGQLGFIDLANVDSLSFVLTDDLTVIDEHNNFKLLGRMTTSEMRGCTLMYESLLR